MKGRTLIYNPNNNTSSNSDRTNNCLYNNCITRNNSALITFKVPRNDLHYSNISAVGTYASSETAVSELIMNYPEVEIQSGSLNPTAFRETSTEKSFYHIYQRSIDKDKIFHSWIDALVFISILWTRTLKSNAEIYALCLMDNHIHLLIRADIRTLSTFVQDYTITFAKVYNKEYGKTGPLFSKRFGRAEKYKVKYLKTCLAYIFNNPVEAHKCSKAEEYVWNLLAFGYSSHPFSDTLDITRARSCMRQAARHIKALHSRREALSFQMLKHLFKPLGKQECLQLRDLILRIYNPTDYSLVTSLYGSMKKALTAINSNTGSEYNIKEDD